MGEMKYRDIRSHKNKGKQVCKQTGMINNSSNFTLIVMFLKPTVFTHVNLCYYYLGKTYKILMDLEVPNFF